MLSDGVYRISAEKHARFQASLTYYDQPVGYAKLRSNGKWYVSINDFNPNGSSSDIIKKDIGSFRALGTALSVLWEQRFNAVAEKYSRHFHNKRR